jgi:hypothetical protein
MNSISVPENNLNRPYTVGATQHDNTLATILLIQDDGSDPGAGSNSNIDFTKDISKPIPTAKPEEVKFTLDQAGPPTPEQQAARDVAQLTKDPDYYPVPNGKAAVLYLKPAEPYYGVFNNFSLLSVSESSDQIVKIHQNFAGNWSAFFLGRKPQVFTFSGFFIDSREYPYYQEFMVAYEKYLAGRKCVERKMRMKILYDGKIVDGYILNIMTSITADTIMMKQFSFSVLVTSSPRWVRFNILKDDTVDKFTGVKLNQYNSFSNKERAMQSGMSNLIDEVSAF